MTSAELMQTINGTTIEIKPGMEAEYRGYVEINSKDGYSAGVIDYADRWARLMQVRMAAGAELAAIAKDASHDADVDGITGSMYGCAVQGLGRFWVHGEQLRVWHNKDYGVESREGDGGGTVNPAIITFGR